MIPTSSQLPIASFEEAIVNHPSRYKIVVAETGAGKSTEIPRWYKHRGHSMLVTEPLIETVIGTSEYVARLEGCEIGTAVGYRTGQYRQDCPTSQVLYTTTELALVREMLGHNRRFSILGIDELHEWRTDQSTLEAWAWKGLQDGTSPFEQVIVMSATIDAAELSRRRGNAPIFEVPGRQFEIEDRKPGASIEDDIRTLVGEGFDILCFQPGAAEINALIGALKDLDAELIPFYGALDRAQKDRAYRSYRRPKVIVSTNALETGRTVLPSEGRQLAVVDSGLENRTEVVNGIEGLYLRPIARVRAKQRRGRTGRVSKGVCIDHCPAKERPMYLEPELRRTLLDRTMLRLKIAGFDMTELPFFHQPEEEQLKLAKESLIALGCMNADGSVTALGRNVSRLPVKPYIGVMCFDAANESNAKGQLPIVENIIDIAAILEGRGIVRGEKRDERPLKWRTLTGGEQESDLIAQLNVLHQAPQLREPGVSRNEVLRDYGILTKQLFDAQDLRRQLAEALRGKVNFNIRGTRQDLLRAVCAGMVDHLFKREGDAYRNGGRDSRELGKESVIRSEPDWIVGIPFDLEGQTESGRQYHIKMVKLASAVDPIWLCEVAPHLARVEKGIAPRVDPESYKVVSITQTFFRDRLVKEETVPDPDHPEAAQVFAQWLAGIVNPYNASGFSAELADVLDSNNKVQAEAITLNWRAGTSEFTLATNAEVGAEYFVRLNGTRSLAEITNPEVLRLSLDPEKAARIRRENPDTIAIGARSLAVSYGQNRAPMVELSAEDTAQGGLLWQLPNQGLLLPGGKAVAVKIPVGYYYHETDTDIPKLKAQIRDAEQKGQWENWEKPAIIGPDASDPKATVPEIEEKPYGTSIEDGTPLIAYGTLSPASRWSSDPLTWETVWTRDDRAKAVEIRNRAIATFEAEKPRAAARAAKERIDTLYSGHNYGSEIQLSDETRSALYEARYSTQPSEPEALRQWIAEIDRVAALVDAAVAEAERRKLELMTQQERAERRLASIVATGTAVRVVSIDGDKVNPGIEFDTSGEATRSDGRMDVPIARGPACGSQTSYTAPGETVYVATISRDVDGIYRLTPAVSLGQSEPLLDLVLLREYDPAGGHKRWPSFHVDWQHAGDVVKAGEVHRSRGSGSDDYTLLLAPRGWGENIASQFKNERDLASQVIAYDPTLAVQLVELPSWYGKTEEQVAAEAAVDTWQEKLEQAESELSDLQRALTDATAEYEAAFEEWVTREDQPGKCPVQKGTVFMVESWTPEKPRDKKDKMSLVSKAFCDGGSGTFVKAVLDSDSPASARIIQASANYSQAVETPSQLARVRPVNREKLNLFIAWLAVPGLKGMQSTKGYLVVPVANPNILEAAIKNVQSSVDTARTKLGQLRQAAEAAAAAASANPERVVISRNVMLAIASGTPSTGSDNDQINSDHTDTGELKPPVPAWSKQAGPAESDKSRSAGESGSASRSASASQSDHAADPGKTYTAFTALAGWKPSESRTGSTGDTSAQPAADVPAKLEIPTETAPEQASVDLSGLLRTFGGKTR